MKLERPTEIIWSSIAQSVQWLGYRLHKQRNKVKFPVQAFLHQSVQKPGAEILYSQQYYYLTPGGVCSLRIYQLWCEASSILEAWFWVCSGVRLVLGLVLLLYLVLYFHLKHFPASWVRWETHNSEKYPNMFTFIFVLVQFFSAQDQPVTCTMDGQRAIPQG